MSVFHFKQFDIDDCGCGQKICSDSVLLAAWFCGRHTGARSIMDIGAGSGVLSLLAACICPRARVTAVEIDAAAAAACRTNFEKSSAAPRLALIEGNFSDYRPDAACELIISNPPYFTNGQLSDDEARAKARHQGSLSYSSLLAYAARNLTEEGHLGLISPPEFEDEIIFKAEMAALKLHRLCRVVPRPGRPVRRLLWDFSLRDTERLSCDTLYLRTAGDVWSEAYLSLVQPYYTKI